MSPGDIYWLHTDVHPHVVLSLSPPTLARITTNLQRAKSPGCVLLDAGEANLPKQSVVLSFSTLTIDAGQLRERIGSLSPERLEQILAAQRFVTHYRD